ncbi:MAG: hypothetical protein KDC66_07075 [Phaeodactylibacter sp.]|nr:hypothetical protein [Phaeodactylibacter sp.]MCB9275372.1 hypothetical protein [Lewinellaceae bacterium]
MRKAVLLLLPLAYCACGPDDDCEERQYLPLCEAVVDNVPYTDDQLLYFRNSEGEVFPVHVNKKMEVLQPDIPYVCEEYLELTMQEAGKSLPFIEFIHRGTSQDCFLQYSISPGRNNRYNGVQIRVLEDGALTGMGAAMFNKHASVELGGVSYSDVIELNYQYDNMAQEDLVQLFYNKEYGILQFSTLGGLVYDREG